MTEEKKMLFSQDALKKLLWPLIIEQFLAIAMGNGGHGDGGQLWRSCGIRNLSGG